jgi:hypothetical protein
MAISWLLKQRIRINPNIIYRLTEEELTEEVVEFVLAQPRFNMQKIRYNGVVFKSETFVKAYIDSPDFKKEDINNIFNQADNFSEELKKILIDKVMAEGINVGTTYVKESMITNNPEFFIYLLEKNNGQLPYFYERGGISVSAYSNEQIDRIYELMTTADPDIEYSRAPGYIRTSDRMFNHFLSNKFEETIKFTKDIIRLRGKDAKTGIVFKGHCTLDWTKFIHQKGRFILGENCDFVIEHDKYLRSSGWNTLSSGWIKNGDRARRIAELALQLDPNVNLCMAGAYDGGIWLPMALCADIFKNPNENFDDILERVNAREIVEYK